MASSNPTIFICSATGTQGLALSRQLRNAGWDIHATVRNLESPAAKILEGQRVKLTLGDWDNKEALTTSMAGCDSLFLNLVADFRDLDRERLQAQAILAIAKAAGIKHVVYSSAVSADAPEKRSGMNPSSPVHRLFFSKNTIEGLVKRAGFEHWTILRPAFFMANFLEPKVRMFPTLLENNSFKTAMAPDTRVGVVDHEDIAKFAVAAFQDPKRFHQQAIELAGEELSPGQLMEELSAAIGRELKVDFYTDKEIEAQSATNPLIEAHLSFRGSYRFLNMDKIKSWGIPLNTFRNFLEREKKAVAETYP